MKREVKFSLVFRDMWQSAGKYVPRVDQLVKVAPAIIEMGCFARVETNGGGFEQVNLLFGENPNKAVREWTKPFHEAGIQTHMLDRALNGLRMSPVPADVRKLFYKVKKAQGTDITRTFCGLNDVRNIAPSITYAKEAGMISQCSLCITHSPIHTVEYYTNMALELIKLGADEICIKDMAGIGRPVSLGKIVANIKAAHPEIPVQYHSHAGPGFNMASILEVCEAGCDYIDVGMEPLSWGTGHAVLCCSALIDGPFAVINADDYYGKEAFHMIYDQLSSVEDTDRYQYTMVGYRLYNTLTENGYVARGVCRTDAKSRLVDIHERTRIEKHGSQAEYTEDDGATWTELPESTIVSMNMWGFTKSILGELENRFGAFLDKNLPVNPMKCEYFLPFVVDELLKADLAEVTVLKSVDRWYGVTYKEDKETVVKAIKDLKDKRLYPEKLWEELVK